MNWSKCAMARASRESLRTGVAATKGVWESWGEWARRGADGWLGWPEVLAPSQSRHPSESGAEPEFRGSKSGGGSLNEDSASCSGAPEDGRHFHLGMHSGRAGDKRDARQFFSTLHPCSRISVRPSSLPHVRIPGVPEYVVYHKKGIYHFLLDGPNSKRMAFSTWSESQKDWSEPVVELQTNLMPAGRCMGDDDDDRVGLHYVRHGSEFLVGVKGSREDVEKIKSRIAEFLRNELHLEVSLASHVHIQAGNVVFLGTRVAGLLDNKRRRRFSKEIEKRRRSKVRAQGMAQIRTDTWHNELKDLAVQSWAFGLKKAKADLQSWETAKQALYKKELQGSKFLLEQIDRGVTTDAIQRLLDKEEEVFMDAPDAGLPQQILRAHQRLTRLLKKHLDEATPVEKKAKRARPQQAKVSTSKADDDESIPIQLLAPMEIITEKLSKTGILQPSKALPTVVTSMLNSSDEAIVSFFTALGSSLLSYYRCCDNFEKIRRLVDHQVRWSALFTLGSKHGCSARKIIRDFSRGPKIVDQEGNVVVEFPSSTDIARTGKKFLVHEQQHSLDDILRSKPLEFRPSSVDPRYGPTKSSRGLAHQVEAKPPSLLSENSASLVI